MNILKYILGIVLLALAQIAPAQESAVWELLPDAKVDSSGIFLNQLVVLHPTSVAASSSAAATSSVVLPQIRLASAPGLGQTASLSRADIIDLLQKSAPALATNEWSGAEQSRVTRKTRPLTGTEMAELLTATLQRDYVKDRGELELNLTRPWTPVLVPDEALSVKVQELPATGVNANFIVRCDLLNGKEKVAEWQLPVQAKIWHDIPVARSALLRGQLLRDADVTMERRDILALRDAFLNFSTADGSLELAENISVGLPVMNRSVHIRPLIRRGRVVEAVYQDGSLSISLKVETLEDGLPGQIVRVRNPKTKRELFGKVQNEQTILITL